MDRLLATSAWTAVLAVTLGAGCSGSEKPQATGGGGGSGGAGSSGSGVGSSGSVASSAASTSGPSAVASTGAGGTSGAGGAAFVCDPPAAPGSIYEASGESLNPEEIEPISMCKYRGEVMLVVNTAAA
jgi:hypothetical protein